MTGGVVQWAGRLVAAVFTPFQRKAAHPVLEREGVDRPTGLVWKALALPFASSVTLGI